MYPARGKTCPWRLLARHLTGYRGRDGPWTHGTLTGLDYFPNSHGEGTTCVKQWYTMDVASKKIPRGVVVDQKRRKFTPRLLPPFFVRRQFATHHPPRRDRRENLKSRVALAV